jgi:hypothetical protein
MPRPQYTGLTHAQAFPNNPIIPDSSLGLRRALSRVAASFFFFAFFVSSRLTVPEQKDYREGAKKTDSIALDRGFCGSLGRDCRISA